MKTGYKIMFGFLAIIILAGIVNAGSQFFGLTLFDSIDVSRNATVDGNLSISGTGSALYFPDGTSLSSNTPLLSGWSTDGTTANTTQEVKIEDALNVSNDLRVDTKTLFVDTTNKRIGINRASPSQFMEWNYSQIDTNVDFYTDLSNARVASFRWINNTGGISANFQYRWQTSSSVPNTMRFLVGGAAVADIIMTLDGNDKSVTIPDLAAGAGTDYICSDTNGKLSNAASCTNIELEENTLGITLAKDEFKVLEVEKELYPADHPTKANKILNDHYKLAFENGGNTYIGVLKVPRTLKYEDEILYYLKLKLDKHKDKNPPRESKTNNLVGVVYTTTEINTDSIVARLQLTE